MTGFTFIYIPSYNLLILINFYWLSDIPRLPDLYSDLEPQSHDEVEIEEESTVINDGKDPVKIVQHTRNPSGPKAPDPQDVNSMKLMPIFGALIAFFGALLLLCRLWRVV